MPYSPTDCPPADTIDIPAMREKYLAERDRRIKKDHNDQYIAANGEYTWEGVNTNTTQTLVDVAQTLPEVLPEGTPAAEVSRYWLETARKIDEERGVFWPKIDSETVGKSGTSWQIFPNQQIGHAVNNMLCYQARPCGYDPDKCYFEVAVYELYPEGEAPETGWVYADPDDFPHVLKQDFSNMAAVQQGMKTDGYRGNIPNPKAEGAVISLHRNLAEFMGTGAPYALHKDAAPRTPTAR